MSAWLWRLVILCCGCFLLEACSSPPKRLLDENLRVVPGGRESVVVIPQGEIRANIVVSNVSASTGAAGGLIGALIGAVVDTTVNQNRANAAEEGVKPLRNAILDYDFDHRALEATQATLAKISWLDVNKVTFTKDGSKDKLLTTLDQSPARQLLVARYDYALSPNFAWLNISLEVNVYSKEVPAGGSSSSRLDRDKALYSQRFVYVEQASQQTKDMEQNAAKWAAEDGEKVRAALAAGLAGVEDLFIRSMSQTPDTAAALDQGRHIDLADQHGNLVETGDKGTLLYDKGPGSWIFVDGVIAPPS